MEEGEGAANCTCGQPYTVSIFSLGGRDGSILMVDECTYPGVDPWHKHTEGKDGHERGSDHTEDGQSYLNDSGPEETGQEGRSYRQTSEEQG